MNKEAYYDEHIAPKLLALAKECEDNGLSLLSVCEWEPGEYGSTRNFQAGSSFAFRMVDTAAKARGNVDSFMMAIERYAMQHGHSSMYLHMRGVPETPNDRVEGRDAASSRRVPSHDGLCGNGSEVGAGETEVDIAQAPDIHAELTMAAFHREIAK